MYAEVDRVRARYRARFGATSFVLELANMPGGTRYSGSDSRHDGDEVGFQRDPGVSAKYIRRVHAVRDSVAVGVFSLVDAARGAAKTAVAEAAVSWHAGA